MAVDVGLVEGFLEKWTDRVTLFPEFKKEFPGVSIIRCDAFDMRDETPIKSLTGYDLYLVDTRDHCVRITKDAQAATGVVVVEKKK